MRMVHQAYGFNLENELSRHPIKELNDPVAKERLMQSLERGNLHQVTFVRGDSQEKMFIEANPLFKTLNIYDAGLKKVYQEPGKRSQQQQPGNGPQVSEPEKKQEKKKEAKEDQEEQAEGKGKKAAPRKRLGV